MITLFLPIESTVRELDYKINLARLFCHKGFDVILGNPAFIRDELKYKNYCAVFLEKGANPDPNYYQSLSDKGVSLYDLSDEGASEPVYSINYQPAVDALKTMRKIFLWGSSQKGDLIRRNSDSVLQKKYVVTGNPGYDVCLQKYIPFNKGMKPSNFPNSYILVNTNFGCIQSYALEDHLEACNLISPLSKQMWEYGYRKESQQWPIFQEWLESIIQAFPDEQFLIRPHPTEISENYKKIFGKYKNVFISKEGSVNYVTASAKLVLHKDCSTAMQGYLMGVPSISLGGEFLYEDYVQWPLNFSLLPKSLDECKIIINQILNNGKIDDKLQEDIDKKAKSILNEYFCNLGNSTQVLVETIIIDSEELIKNFSPYKLVDTRSFIQKLKLFIRRRMPLHYKVPKAARETMIEFTKGDVIRRLNLLESVDPTGSDYVVKKIFPNTFKIARI